MKKIILLITLLGLITDLRAENTKYFIDSLKLVLKTCPNDSTRVKSLNELSAYLVDMDSYNEALIVAQQAKVLSEKLGYRAGVASSLRKMGVNFTQQGNYPKALDFLLKSLKINDSLKVFREIFMLNNNIGTVYCLQKDYRKALDYFFKASSYKNNDAITISNIGWAFFGQGKYQSSIVYYEKSLKLYNESSDKRGIANMLNNIGTTYEYLNQDDKALKYYFESLKIMERIEDNQGQIDALSGIGDILIKQKKYKDAIEYENKSLMLAKQIGYLYSVQETEKQLSEIYDKIGKKNRSYEHYKRYILIRDSLYDSEQTKSTVRAEMNFDFDKKQEIEKLQQDKKDAIQIEKLKQQHIQLNAFIWGFTLILIFSIFLFRIFKKTQKQKNIIEEQKKIVEHKTQELTDNINYASKIQKAVLPSEEYMKVNLPEHFLITKPRDIVNGDFYWLYRDGNDIYFSTADCTSHGSSAALLTMIGSALLNEIVIERKITQPDLVLNTLREEVIKALNKSGATEERKEGMDLVFCKLSDMKLECACANNSIYIIRDKELIQIKSNRYPIGKYLIDSPPFTLHTMALQKSDILYTFSDGFQDQFGGPNNKKLMSKQFKEWAIELSTLPMIKIKQELENRLINWIGEGEQTDDITVLSIRI